RRSHAPGGGSGRGIAELEHRARIGGPDLSGTSGRARPAPGHQPEAPEARAPGRPHARAGLRAPQAELRAGQRAALRGPPGTRPGAPAAAGAGGPAPPAAPPRLRAPAGRRAPPLLRPPRRRRARPRTDDRLPRRLLVDGGGEGDLVEGGGPDAARDRAAAATS